MNAYILCTMVYNIVYIQSSALLKRCIYNVTCTMFCTSLYTMIDIMSYNTQYNEIQ